MSAENQIIEKILSVGKTGIKKSDLKKQFKDYPDLEDTLQRLLSNGEIVIEKKGTTLHCWHKDCYFESILENDIKFRFLYNSILEIQKSTDSILKNLNIHTDNLDKRIAYLIDFLLNHEYESNNKNNQISSNTSNTDLNNKFDIIKFKDDFDSTILSSGNSLGWVELAKIRNLLCEKYDISEKEFYLVAENLVKQFESHYELSTGGNEGVLIRGLLHGFVRCI